MTDNIINQTEPIVKVRPNLWQAGDGAVIGFGAILAPGGLYFCFSCNTADCPHVATVDGEWLAGRDSVLEDYQVPTTSGYHTPATVTAPPIGQTVVTQTDIDAVGRGSRPGAWKAQSREELPSGWPNTRVLR